MKTRRIIALALALITATSLLAACGNSSDDPASTTTAATTPAADADVTTTAAPDNDEEPEVIPPETPVVGEAEIAALFATGDRLNDLVVIEEEENEDGTTTLLNPTVSENMVPWDDGKPTQMFDGNTKSTKCGGDVDGVAEITWETEVPTTITAYVIYTGNDSASYGGRTPTAWEFLGSNDGEAWTRIDKVSESGMEDVDATPYGYKVDEPAEYSHYKFIVSATTPDPADDTDGEEKTLLQMNEFVMIGSANGLEAETPLTGDAVTDLIASKTDLREHVVVEEDADGNLVWPNVSASMAPWDDGKPTQMFDGNTTTTKLGGDVTGTVEIVWKTDVKTTLEAYVLYTGNDSGQYVGRTPISWVLYGSPNGNVWTVLDRVGQSGMEDVNATPYGYTIDNPAGFYQYKLHITYTTPDPADDTDGEATTLVQLNEFVMLGTAAE